MVFGNIDYVQLPSPRDRGYQANESPGPPRFVTFLLPFTILRPMIGRARGWFLLVAIWKQRDQRGLSRSFCPLGSNPWGSGHRFLIGPMSIPGVRSRSSSPFPRASSPPPHTSLLYVAKVLAGLFTGRLLFRIFGLA